ncbi:Receptor expression-enhancing protein 4 [Fragariocoptes setiger]|uniref:Receptor expression-enhancing protein n=1 Tax=Fragariocoptes setiger TaxID=1670756 RepID=A0ABQ7S5B0_9ACAR|nr:Receptor expression-enhancing protein 4 [Fragariocoptes setiger]
MVSQVTLSTISAMLARLFYPYISLGLGALYPAYASWKSIKNRDRQQYQRWMMYWVTFAAFQAFEVFADIFIAFWLPFYYEIKVLLLIWLVSLGGQGAKLLYIHLINDELSRREQIIDRYMDRVSNLSNDLIRRLWHEVSKIFPLIMSIFLRVMIATSEGLPGISMSSDADDTTRNPSKKDDTEHDAMEIDQVDFSLAESIDDAFSDDATTKTLNKSAKRSKTRSKAKLCQFESDEDDENFNHIECDNNRTLVESSAPADTPQSQTEKSRTRKPSSTRPSRKTRLAKDTENSDQSNKEEPTASLTDDKPSETDDPDVTDATALVRRRAVRKPRAVKKTIFYTEP